MKKTGSEEKKVCVCVCGKRRNLTWDSFPSFYSRAFEFSNGAAAGTGSNVCDTCTQAVAGEGILAPLGDTETVLCARPRPASSPPGRGCGCPGLLPVLPCSVGRQETFRNRPMSTRFMLETRPRSGEPRANGCVSHFALGPTG